MERRLFLGLTISAALSQSAYGQATKMLDCGPVDSKACADEREWRRKYLTRIGEWKAELAKKAEKIATENDRYDNYFVAFEKDGPTQVVSGGIFDSNFDRAVLYLKVIPLPDVNGSIASKATVTVWRKSGFGANKNVSVGTSGGTISVKERRSYKIGEFSGPCVVLWETKAIKVDSDLPPGCYPKGAVCD